MRVAASTTAEILEELIGLLEPGLATWSLEEEAERQCRKRGVTPAFKGLYGCPTCLLVSLNDEVVHGLPRPDRRIAAGDVVSLDFGVVYRGWYGDHARTVCMPGASEADERLVSVTRASIEAAAAACRVGGRLSDIARAVESVVLPEGYSIVEDFVGHGIGRRLHEDPQVPNRFDAAARMPLREGLVLCVEPMVNFGGREVKVVEDGWTAVTVDGTRSAHFEHTIAITAGGPEILSRPGFGAGRD
jgi:methionyl aminopeptidase